MATIKSYTDIEQSKKLAEILPLDSADMWCSIVDDEIFVCLERYYEYEQIPCWSLAALLDILPEKFYPTKYNPSKTDLTISKAGGKWYVIYWDETGMQDFEQVTAINLVDACVEMILKLNELNLL